MKTIYSAGRQAWKVRLVQWLALLTGPVAVWGGWEIARAYGLHPSEGGALAPLPLRLALGGFVATLGVSFIVGMWVYGRCYAMEAAVDERRGVPAVTLAGLPLRARMEVPLMPSRRPRQFHARVSVNAPWTSVRLRGRRLTLIVDEQGDFLRPVVVAEHLFPDPCRRTDGMAPAR